MMDRQLDQVQQMIAERSRASRTRIHVVAEILRDLLAADDKGEVMLAFTLVMAEVPHSERAGYLNEALAMYHNGPHSAQETPVEPCHECGGDKISRESHEAFKARLPCQSCIDGRGEADRPDARALPIAGSWADSGLAE